jgi:23S rRNA pseudouridine1911/1915/1917 synthase
LLPRQALHAQSLGFIHPSTKEYVHFESPLPPDFKAALTKWENYIVTS